MSIPIVAFFNNKGGVGKTSLVYHIAWACDDLGRTVLAADLDPQSNLTAGFLDENELDALWYARLSNNHTIFDALQPLIRGTADIQETQPYEILGAESLCILPGDLSLANIEDTLAETWPKCLDGDYRAFLVQSALWRVLQQVARTAGAELILVDLGPSLGALNRAALLASNFVVVPLAADLFSIRGLENLGPRLRSWRDDWRKRRAAAPLDLEIELPLGQMSPVGYVVQQHSVRLDRPTAAYDRWSRRIPNVYWEAVLGTPAPVHVPGEPDPQCLALLKNYRSLIPLAQEARKPVFHLRAADGALGAHANAARQAGQDFIKLTEKILERTVERQPVIA